MADFPKEFKCECGSEETVSSKGIDILVKRGTLKETVTSSLKKVVVPLIDPQLATLTLPALLLHYDNCWKCGKEYLILIEWKDLPITGKIQQGGPGQALPGQGGQGFPFNRG